MRRWVALGLGLVGALLLLVPASPGRAAVPVLVIDGRGWGHGVGMAQDGALAMGRDGASTGQILAQFYPGTGLGRAGGEVRVGVLAAGEVVLVFPSGGEVRDARAGGQSAGFPLTVPRGGQVRLGRDGSRYTASLGGRVRARQVPTLLPPVTLPPAPPAAPAPPPPPPPPPPPAPAVPPPAVASSSRPLWAVPAGGGVVSIPARGRSYRGVLTAVADGGMLRVVNHLDVEQYLRGMGEVLDPGWPPAALRAQAIAARTYALLAARGGVELCDDQQCQVYLGSQAEYAAMDRAVAATRGQVVVFRGALAETVYSANAGGVSATPEEGFGRPGPGYPYLRTAPYPTQDPLPWTVKIALRDVAARVRYPGGLTGVRVGGMGPSGRVVQVVLEGEAGPRTMSGIDFDKALGLRSTLFTLRLEEAEAAPPPPPPAESARAGPLAIPEGPADALAPATTAGGGSERESRWSAPAAALLALAAALTLGAAGGTAFVVASGAARS